MIAGHGFYYSSVRFLFFSMDFLFGVMLCMWRGVMLVNMRREKERLTSTCNWRELGS
jgi:hypothetical protein